MAAPTFRDPRIVLSTRLIRKTDTFYPEQPVRRALSIARRPGDIRALISFLRSLPNRQAAVPTELRPALAGRLDRGLRLPFGLRDPLAVLDLADTMEANLQGRSRQAIRTNVRRARTLGVTARRIAGDDLDNVNRQARARLRAHGKTDVTTGPFHGGPRQVEVASFTADGTLLVVGAASCWGPWAVLEMFMRFSDLPETSDARYLTHVALLEQLIAAGVRHLVAEETLLASDNRRYQYHLLGYRPAWVTVEGTADLEGRTLQLRSAQRTYETVG